MSDREKPDKWYLHKDARCEPFVYVPRADPRAALLESIRDKFRTFELDRKSLEGRVAVSGTAIIDGAVVSVGCFAGTDVGKAETMILLAWASIARDLG